MSSQSGLSLIATVLALLLFSLFIAVAVSLVTTGASIGLQEEQGVQAFYIAEGGLENAIVLLNTSNLTNRIACGSVTGNPNLTNEPLGTGQFTVTADASSPFYSLTAATLAAGGINSTATTINTVAAPVGYASSGRIMIDRELIDYSSISGNSFIGAVRGRDGTTPASHAANAPVGQYQCSVTSAGGIPTVAAPTAKRTVKEGIQLQEGWVVGAPGAVVAQWPLFLRFQQRDWSIYDSTLLNINLQLNGISMLSYADGWAVGNPGGIAAQRPLVLRYTNGAWVSQNTGLGINRALNSIYCVASNDCWAVGDPGAGTQRPWIVQYNGAWSTIITGNVANAPLNSVYCPASGNCWAVGNATTGGGGFELLVYRLAAGVWARQAASGFIPDQNLMSVFCTSTTECFIAGALGTLARWNGAAWTNVSLGALQLNSLYMLDTNGDNVADDGWTVGNSNGTRPVVFRWNTNCNGVGTTGSWNDCTLAAYVPAINTPLNNVFCVDSNDCWAVGNASGGEVILHWEGTTWARVGPSAAIPDVNLRSVYIIGSKQRPQAAWQEVFP